MIYSMHESLTDYPREVALVIAFAKCNLRCYFCHNRHVVENAGYRNIAPEVVVNKIDKASKTATAVVFTGGEPLMSSFDLMLLASTAKNMGMKTKLDTNGYFPDELASILHLFDYVEIDIKAPFERYYELFGHGPEKVKRSLEILRSNKKNFAVRTTVAPLLSPADLYLVASRLEHGERYYLQEYLKPNFPFDEKLCSVPHLDRDAIKKCAKGIVKTFRVDAIARP